MSCHKRSQALCSIKDTALSMHNNPIRAKCPSTKGYSYRQKDCGATHFNDFSVALVFVRGSLTCHLKAVVVKDVLGTYSSWLHIIQ